jgi:hypothetical protein
MTAEKLPDRSGRDILAVLAIGFVIVVAGYRLLHLSGMSQTAAMYIGLPAILAIAVVWTVRPSSAVGCVTLVATYGLLLAWLVLDEGVICVLMAAPLFYAGAIVPAVIIDNANKRRKEGEQSGGWQGLLFIPLLAASLEGVVPRTGTSVEVVNRSLVVAMNPAEVARTIESEVTVAAKAPGFLRFGFPRPTSASGTGARVGDTRSFRFATGETVFRITASEPGHVTYTLQSDTSPIAGWLAWRRADLRWSTEPGGGTRLTWQAEYERLLAPGWYFGPLERRAVQLVGDYFLRGITLEQPGP